MHPLPRKNEAHTYAPLHVDSKGYHLPLDSVPAWVFGLDQQMTGLGLRRLISAYFALPVYPCAIVGIAIILFRALGVPHPP